MKESPRMLFPDNTAIAFNESIRMKHKFNETMITDGISVLQSKFIDN